MNSISYETRKRLEKESRIIREQSEHLKEIERLKGIIRFYEELNQVNKEINKYNAKYNQNQTLEG